MQTAELIYMADDHLQLTLLIRFFSSSQQVDRTQNRCVSPQAGPWHTNLNAASI